MASRGSVGGPSGTETHVIYLTWTLTIREIMCFKSDLLCWETPGFQMNCYYYISFWNDCRRIFAFVRNPFFCLSLTHSHTQILIIIQIPSSTFFYISFSFKSIHPSQKCPFYPHTLLSLSFTHNDFPLSSMCDSAKGFPLSRVTHTHARGTGFIFTSSAGRTGVEVSDKYVWFRSRH